MEYIPNGGQTYLPIQDNIHIPTLPFTPLSAPTPSYAPLELTESCREKGYVITTQAQHFLPGVSAKMMDWWWANRKKAIISGLPAPTSALTGSRVPASMAS